MNTRRNRRDSIGGTALVIIGAAIVIYTMTTMRLGGATRPGPGAFPMALGAILAGLGLSIAVPTLFQRNLEPVGRILMRDLKTVIAVFASILAFGFSVGLFGLLPATVVLTLVASRADGGLSLRGALILAAALSAVAVIVFRWGLGVPFVLFTWPW